LYSNHEETALKRKRFGETLLDAGLITQDQLDNALALHKGKNRKLGTILLELDYVNAKQIAEALSKQLSLKLVSCLDYTPDTHLLKLITRETALHNVVLPLEKNGSNLLLAMANPLDYQVVDNISFRTGLSLNIAVAPEDDILHAI
jgi:type IV pilus assembly protein PilB